MMNRSWWAAVDGILKEKSLLRHPFYQAWSRGALGQGDLAFYACQYYQQESRFPRYLSAVHSRCPDSSARRVLLENLNHEEAGAENHAELWLRFAEAVGASRETVLSAKPSPETRDCVEAFEGLTSDANWTAGAAALYAYEAQQPSVAETKMKGLREHYGINSPAALRFFEAHREMDLWHSGSEKKILMDQARRDPALKDLILKAVSEACDALNRLLDGVVVARGIACAA